MAKNPGLNARKGSVQAALDAAKTKSPAPEVSEESAKGFYKAISVRLDRRRYEGLRKLAYDREVKIHQLLLEGIDHVLST